jgi:dTDP-4-dehydrorhamnose reductase
MRVLVTGRLGQVVTALTERGKHLGHEILAVGRPELDLAQPRVVRAAIEAAAPDVVVSAAAYTSVDRAETEIDKAFAINTRGAGAVAEAARHLRVPLVHVSTDYVYSGLLRRPYTEADQVAPLGVYGASKLAGEEAVLATHGDNAAVLRVAWVYSPFGSNFVKTMLRLASERDEISVVADQLGNPTSALDIADGILKVAENLLLSNDSALRGVFNMTARGEASWAEFAREIFKVSAAFGGAVARVRSITTADYPTAATRPENSRLDCGKIELRHGVVLPQWGSVLPNVVQRLISSPS